MNPNVIILPGLNNSEPAHWQSRWQKANKSFRRIEQRDWELPVCAEWVLTLDSLVAETGPDTVLVAHSIACLMVVRWALNPRPIRGALLVAVPDPAGIDFPAEAAGFSPVPRSKLPFPSVVVASNDDIFADIKFAKRCAAAWGSQFVDIGAAGHINAESQLGDWPQGFDLLKALLASPGQAEQESPKAP